MHKKLKLALEAAGIEPEYQLGENYRCPCPNCGSHDNLAVRWNTEQHRVQAYCWSCSNRSLYPESNSNRPQPNSSAAKKVCVGPECNPEARLVCRYSYTDATGKCWTRKERYEPASQARNLDGSFKKKDFCIEYREERTTVGRPSGKTYHTVAWCTKKPVGFTQDYIYAYPRFLHAVSSGEYVFLVDGEKDADVLLAAGYSATCAPNGDGSLPQWAVRQLIDAKIVVVCDRDKTGYTSAWKKAGLLRGQVYTFLESAVGKDTYDHYAAGGDLSSMVRISAHELYRRSIGVDLG